MVLRRIGLSVVNAATLANRRIRGV